MGFKIKPKDFEKRRSMSKTYKDWKDEDNKFQNSLHPSFGAVTEQDLIFNTRKSKNTILDDEYIECENTKEVIDVLLGKKTKGA